MVVMVTAIPAHQLLPYMAVYEVCRCCKCCTGADRAGGVGRVCCTPCVLLPLGVPLCAHSVLILVQVRNPPVSHQTRDHLGLCCRIGKVFHKRPVQKSANRMRKIKLDWIQRLKTVCCSTRNEDYGESLLLGSSHNFDIFPTNYIVGKYEFDKCCRGRQP